MQSDSEISEEQLSALVDGELSEAQAVAVGSQIESDASARAAAEDFAQIKAMLGSMAPPEAPPGFWESVEDGVRVELAAGSASVPPQRHRGRLAGLASAAAIIVVALFAAVLAVSPGGDDTQVAGPATEDAVVADETGTAATGDASSDAGDPSQPEQGGGTSPGASDQDAGTTSDTTGDTTSGTTPDGSSGAETETVVQPDSATPTAVTAQSAPTLLFPQTLLVTTTTTTTTSTTSTTTTTTLP